MSTKERVKHMSVLNLVASVLPKRLTMPSPSVVADDGKTYKMKKCVHYMGEWRLKNPSDDYYATYLADGMRNMTKHFHMYSPHQQAATRVVCYATMLVALILIGLTFASALTGGNYVVSVAHDVWQSVMNAVLYVWHPFMT